MKKLLVIALVAASVAGAYRRIAADRAEADLWAQATAPEPPDLR